MMKGIQIQIYIQIPMDTFLQISCGNYADCSIMGSSLLLFKPITPTQSFIGLIFWILSLCFLLSNHLLMPRHDIMFIYEFFGGGLKVRRTHV